MLAEEFAHHRGMRHVENDKLGDALGMQESRAPSNCGAPIMSGEEDFFLAELIGDGDNVRNEISQSVSRHAAGFTAEVVAALVGNDDAKAGSSQRFDLAAPSITEFRESM